MLKIIGALITVATLVTVGWVLDDRYAKAGQAKQNQTDIKINQCRNDIRWYQDQMSYIMMRSGVRDPNRLPEYAYKSYMDYKIRKEDLDKELKILMQNRK